MKKVMTHIVKLALVAIVSAIYHFFFVDKHCYAFMLITSSQHSKLRIPCQTFDCTYALKFPFVPKALLNLQMCDNISTMRVCQRWKTLKMAELLDWKPRQYLNDEVVGEADRRVVPLLLPGSFHHLTCNP